MKKSVVITIASVIVGLLFIGGILYLVLVTGMEHVEDTNGDDASLNTLILEDAVKERSSIASGVFELSSGGITGVSMMYEDYDFTDIEYRSTKFSGSHIVLATKMYDGDALTIEWSLQLESGNLEMALCDEDFNIIEVIDIQSVEDIDYTASEAETIFLVIVGETASLEIITSRTID